ncbi:hypothetical protein C8J57DRAFT_1235780 [Mycena rebaudengoi]|nr:hypothetical protein C8J57DRAFT_1235780 [Mycena rebaudengoi]
MHNCPGLTELFKNNIIAYNSESRVRMKDGTFIWKLLGESMVDAACRMSLPRVMMATLDRQCYSNAYYQAPICKTRLTAHHSDSEDDNLHLESNVDDSDSDPGYHTDLIQAFSESDPESDSDDAQTAQRVYLTVPHGKRANWAIPNNRTMCKQTFDGIHLPTKEQVYSWPNKQLRHDLTPNSAPAAKPLNLPKPFALNPSDNLPEIQPVDARSVRFDIPMPKAEAANKEDSKSVK